VSITLTAVWDEAAIALDVSAERVFEKFDLGASRLSMRRMAARSMKARSLELQLVVFAQATISAQPRKRALHDPSQAHHLEGALPALGDVQRAVAKCSGMRR
jgi:hypothetical protein